VDPKLIAFIVLSAILTVTPGVDMALVTRNTLSRGRSAAFATTLGVTSGLPIHAFLSAVGLSVILSRSALAFETVKFLGAGYLLYLGIRTFIMAGKPEGHDSQHRPGSRQRPLNLNRLDKSPRQAVGPSPSSACCLPPSPIRIARGPTSRAC
jgi:threonine/homoserine/homoserine lactone efflux protein